MTDEDKELNRKLIEALGFEEYEYKSNGRPVKAWRYPERFSHLRTSSPEHNPPYLLGMLEDAIDFAKENTCRHVYN